MIFPDHRHVRRNDLDVDSIDLSQLFFLGFGRTRHPGQLVVETEQVLEGNRGERAALVPDVHSLLGFHRLMQSLAIAAACHQASGELVDYYDFGPGVPTLYDLAVLEENVVFSPVVERLGAERLLQVVDELIVLFRVEVVDL